MIDHPALQDTSAEGPVSPRAARLAALILEGEASLDVSIALMAEHTELMQRPVVVRGDRAVLARPVERVEELFG